MEMDMLSGYHHLALALYNPALPGKRPVLNRTYPCPHPKSNNPSNPPSLASLQLPRPPTSTCKAASSNSSRRRSTYHHQHRRASRVWLCPAKHNSHHACVGRAHAGCGSSSSSSGGGDKHICMTATHLHVLLPFCRGGQSERPESKRRERLARNYAESPHVHMYASMRVYM